MIVQSDARAWLAGLEDESVDLVATDPPYCTGYNFEAYSDQWDSRDAFIDFMREWVAEAHRALKPTGSLYIQCDWRADAYIRVMLDEVFGDANFRNSIAVKKQFNPMTSQFNRRVGYGVKFDTIFFYAKSKQARCHPFDKLSLKESIAKYPHLSEDGRRYNWNARLHLSAFNQVGRKHRGTFEWHGMRSEVGWRLSEKSMDEEFERGDIQEVNGTLKRRQYQPEEGELIHNLWDDIKIEQGKGRYPTQKPLALYERIIKCSSSHGDLVIDPFCGSGTTLLAAKRLGRRWAGCDANADAVALANRRIAELLL